MNKYLEKIAKQSKDEHRNAKVALGAGASLAGASYAKTQFDRGHITGRETLFHGTTANNKKEILEHGLKPRAKPGIIDTFQKATGKDLKSDHISFMTKSRLQAHTYANQATRLEKGTFDMNDPIGRLKDSIPRKASREGIVNINAPTWKKDEFTKVRNPEVRNALRQTNENFLLSKAQKNVVKKQMYDALESKVFANKGPVSNKYMKGATNYSRNSAREIGQYLKAHPTRALKGSGKALAGLALAGAGAYFAKEQFKHGK